MATLDTPTPEQGTIGMSTLQTGSIALVGIVMIAGILGNFVRRAFDSPSMYFPQWIAVWLAISTLICTWDASFVLNRETSIDSFNNPIWMPYQDYVKVDQLYGKVNNDFVFSQSILNIVEICINILALYLLSKKEFKQASVTALVACAMTSSKTVLYHVMEYSACSESHGIEGCNTNQNDSAKFWIMYILPNGVWIWVPMYACICLGKALSSGIAETSVDLDSDSDDEEEDSEEDSEEDLEEDLEEIRGTCIGCGEHVLLSQERGVDHSGHWYHQQCFEDFMNNQHLDDDDEEEEEEEEEEIVKPKKKSRAKSKKRAVPKKKAPKKKAAKKTAKSNKYVRTTTLVANLRDPEVDKDISTTLRPRSRRRSTRNR